MHQFHPETLIQQVGVLEIWYASPTLESTTLSPDFVSDAEFILGSCERECSYVGLSASIATIRRTRLLLSRPDPPGAEFRKLLDELIGRIRDELSGIVFLTLTTQEAEHYENPRRGWEDILARFPETLRDVEEARKCYALGRYASAIFHSLQVVEAGLLELGKFIKVSDPHSGWTAVANALAQTIKKSHKDRSAFERKNYPFLEQVQGTVEALKNAWRNKISHTQGKLYLLSADFTPEIAEEILFATRSFMRRLADGLPSTRSRKAGGGVFAGLV